MEEELGIPLFERRNDGLYPTMEAIQFKLHAENILREFDTIHRKSFLKHSPDILLNVFCTYSVMEKLGAEFFIEFYRQYPYIGLNIIEMPDYLALEGLRQNSAELALVSDIADTREFSVQHLYDNQYLYVVPASHPLAKRKELSLEDIENEPQIHKGGSFGLYLQQRDLFEKKGLFYKVLFTTSSYYMAIMAAETGQAIGVVPDCIARTYISDKVVFIPVKEEELKKPVFLVTKRGLVLSDAALAFCLFLKEKIIT